jgi:CMP-N,N'-diacetyllegionaminic acid synthase
MRILALIPARAGSKRLPGKNIRMLGGKPLIVWTIDVAKGIPEICDIFVSTDSSEIAEICKKSGVLVPWLRPADLATDTASSVDVALHALNWYESDKTKVDGILLLQPTSPFRTKATVQRGIELFSKHGHQPVLGVSPTHGHPMWTLKMEGDYLAPYMKEHALDTRSQDLPPAYLVNGGFYLISPTELRACKSFVGIKTVPLLIESKQEALDIDTEWDFKMAGIVCRDFAIKQ